MSFPGEVLLNKLAYYFADILSTLDTLSKTGAKASAGLSGEGLGK